MNTSRMTATLCGLGLTIAACGGGGDATPDASSVTAASTVAVGDAEPAGATTSTLPENLSTAANEPEPAASATSDAPTETVISEASTTAPALLQFSAPLVGGGEIDGTTLAGKPTIFWFWAPT